MLFNTWFLGYILKTISWLHSLHMKEGKIFVPLLRLLCQLGNLIQGKHCLYDWPCFLLISWAREQRLHNKQQQNKQNTFWGYTTFIRPHSFDTFHSSPWSLQVSFNSLMSISPTLFLLAFPLGKYRDILPRPRTILFLFVCF